MRFLFYFVFLRWFIRILFCAQQDPVERLFVSIEGDIDGLMKDVEEGVEQASDKLEDLDEAGSRTGQGLKSSAGVAGFAFGLAAGAAAKLLDIVVNLAVAIPQFFANTAKEAVALNQQWENFTARFNTLLDGAGAAQVRLDELQEFAVATPFNLDEIVAASVQLEGMGASALSTGDNLRLLGDAVAASQAPFENVLLHVGRLFNALQSGRPFGESAAELTQLGLISGDTINKMQAMQKAGEDGQKVWDFFAQTLDKQVGGAMAEMAKTFTGTMSNIEDFRDTLIRTGGEPFFEEVRDSAKQFLDLLNENEGTITDIATGIGELAAGVIRFAREGLGGINISGVLDQIKSFVDWLNRTSQAFQAAATISGKFLQSLSPVFDFIKMLLAAGLSPLIEGFKALGQILSRTDEAMIAAAQGLAIITATIEGLKVSALGAWEVMKNLAIATFALATGNVDLLVDSLNGANAGIAQVQSGADAFKTSMLESAASIDAMINPTEEATEAVEDLGDAMDDVEDTEVEPIIDPGKLDSFTNQMIEATENRNQKLAELEQNHAEKIAGIMSDATEKRLSIEDKFNDDMGKLAGDSEKERLKVIADTRAELAELAKDTDRELSERRDEFNRDELRDTEDHLREMRRLQEDHLDNLTDAVKNRDARAVVDLQRRFALESQRREEDFQTKQGRGDQDFDLELQKTRDSEAERRAEILASQAAELESIKENEAEKSLEIQARRDEGLEKLRENLNERLNRENQNYAERQMALDEALRKQLEAIAKNLSDEKDVTEEGAKQILETFNEYFGVGGNIDELMEGFSKRRRIRADIRVDFESDGDDGGTSPTSGGPGLPPQQLGGAKRFAEGGTLIANKPTLALFGEAGPEVVQFTPIDQLSNPASQEPGRMVIEMTGSAPPGIGVGERDQIAAVLVSALRETGELER